MLKNKIAIVGLGYVGLPLAAAFAAKKYKVVGFDLNKEKIDAYKGGEDPTCELTADHIEKLKCIEFTDDERKISGAHFIIVAVPTPVGTAHVPDLKPLENASEIVGRNLKKGVIVIYESTVYPGVTEDICVPILERESGLTLGVDFMVGYSPERINPGDKVNTLEKITKIVSGNNDTCLDQVTLLYQQIIKAGVHRAPSIKVAEAAKVIENAQRDVNIAFMNELSIMFHMMGIDTKEVLEAAGTKWNFIKFSPGLVGGHCISVDPYYLTYRSEELGYVSQLILAARRINNMMGNYIAHETIKEMLRNGIDVTKAQVLVLGVTFKENCGDLRNSKVFEIIEELQTYGVTVHVADPIANKEEVRREHNITLTSSLDGVEVQTVILTVAHDIYRLMGEDEVQGLYKKNSAKVFVDVKGVFDKGKFDETIKYWRL